MSNTETLLQKDQDEDVPETVITRNRVREIISQTLKGATNLANLLPTSIVLAFQVLAPIFTNQGDCRYVNQVMTSTLLVICALSSFVLNFTDSYKDKNGNLSYGFATLNGLWLVDSEVQLPPQLAAKYRLKVMDFVHGFTSVLVFTAITLSENNIVKCFFPSPSKDLQQILTAAPAVIGVVSSFMFVLFPAQRHGINSLFNLK
ncbi:Protein DMP4 [Bienertia sinuspersici]